MKLILKIFRQIFLWGTLLVSLLLLYHVYKIRFVACETPVKYVIGKIDPKFGVSQGDLLKITESATLVWERAYGKDLFSMDSVSASGNIVDQFLKKYIDIYYTRKPLVVNLIYDERQKIADQNRQLTTRIEDTKESADDIKKEFLALQNEYKQVKVEYEVALEDYKNGGGSRGNLEGKVREINSLVDQINALIKKYNYLVKEVNTNVQIVNQNTGEFEEGEYISDEKGERISIYEFENRTVLTRVLAHEFGHALGLEHNDNADSIMYYLNKSSNMQPTKEDLGDLKKICKK